MRLMGRGCKHECASGRMRMLCAKGRVHIIRFTTGCQAKPTKKAATERSAANSRPMSSVRAVGTTSPRRCAISAVSAYTPLAYSSWPEKTPMAAPRPVRKKKVCSNTRSARYASERWSRFRAPSCGLMTRQNAFCAAAYARCAWRVAGAPRAAGKHGNICNPGGVCAHAPLLSAPRPRPWRPCTRSAPKRSRPRKSWPRAPRALLSSGWAGTPSLPLR